MGAAGGGTRGCGRALPGSPGPALGACGHREPPGPHSLPGHRGAIQPAPRTTGTFVSICDRGLNGDIVPAGPTAGPSAPRHQPGLAPQLWVTAAVPEQWHPLYTATVPLLVPGDSSWPGRHLPQPELTWVWGARSCTPVPASSPGHPGHAPSAPFRSLADPRPPSSLPLCFHGFMALMAVIFWHLQHRCDKCGATTMPSTFPPSNHASRLGAQSVPWPHQEGSALSLVHHPTCGRVKKGLPRSWIQPWLFLLPADPGLCH